MNKNSLCWKFWECNVAPFWGLWEKRKFVSGANVWYIFVEIAWMHMWANVGFRENIHVMDAKWDNDNYGGPQRSHPWNSQFLPCFLDGLNQLIRIKIWLDVVVVVRKQEIFPRAFSIGVVEWSRLISWIYCYSYVVCWELYALANKLQRGEPNLFLLLQEFVGGIPISLWALGK